MARIEEAKAAAAKLAVSEHFSPSFTLVGIGSGSTVVYVVREIQATPGLDAGAIQFVSTGAQSRNLIESAGLTVLDFDRLPAGALLDVCFDGADEVDDELNLIKGGGACLYQEKLVATHARKFVCVADERKRQHRLLTNWPAVPVEVEPLAVNSVLAALVALGSKDPAVRPDKGTGVPLRTDQNNLIVDAPFAPLLTSADVGQDPGSGQGSGGIWEVGALSQAVKQIEGVLSVGIFSGEDGVQATARGSKLGGQKPVIAYFGMQDGSVTTRTAPGT